MHSHRQLNIFLMKSSLPRSSSRLTAVARSHRLRLFTRSLRTCWRFGVGAAASSLWLFWVPPTHRRIYESVAVRSPFICCASTAGNADSRATSRIFHHKKQAVHPYFLFQVIRSHYFVTGLIPLIFFIPFDLYLLFLDLPKLLLGGWTSRLAVGHAEVTSRRLD